MPTIPRIRFPVSTEYIKQDAIVDSIDTASSSDRSAGNLTEAVADLQARITFLDVTNKVIAHLGHDPARLPQVLADNFALRQHPELWQAGKFIHPHDACFDHDGNICLAEWVAIGRVSFLKHVG